MLQKINTKIEPSWVAIYVKHNFEKIVFRHLINKKIETFLPVHKVLKRWSDRKKWMEVPLFKNYLFARVTPKEWVKILETRGVFNLVSFSGEVVLIPDYQIENVRRFLGASESIDVVDSNLSPGELVVITKGTLMGMQGRMVLYKGKKRIAINIEYLGKTILMDIPTEYVARSGALYRENC